ncbi:MAG: FecR family protein [Treponema sp.]|jgi:hypothetical protein|nr:FecR family protein [Treponema sp.]
MQKKRNIKSAAVTKTVPPQKSKFLNGTDYVIILLCLAALFFSLRLFWTDLNRSLSRAGEVSVGTISWKQKAAQRRFVDRVLWDRLQKESPVYNGDLIRTADLSEATITYRSGEMINLAENTLIQISREDDVLRLDLTQGDISIDTSDGTGKGIVLSMGTTNITVSSGGVVSAAASDDGGFKLAVSEGSVTVNTAAGAQEMAAGDAFVFDTEGNALFNPIAAPLSPRSGARYLNPEKGTISIPFIWKAVNYTEDEMTRLEVAEDRGFTRIAVKEETKEDHLSVNLNSGIWWWRVYPDSGETGITGKLTITQVSAPALITPAEGYAYRYRSRQPAVRFQWTEAAASGNDQDTSPYFLEVSDNPEFRESAIQTQVRGTSMVYSKLGNGRWYWRVRPVFSENIEKGTFTGISPVHTFAIESTDALRAPVLSSPNNGSRINIAAERQDIYFAWKPDMEADTYTIRISRSEDLSSPLIRETVYDNVYIYGAAAGLPAGQYYWAVYQTDIEGNDSPLSAVRLFSAVEAAEEELSPPVPFPAPAVIRPVNNSAATIQKTDKMEFRWRNIEGADYYLFRLFNQANRERPLFENTAYGETAQAMDWTEYGDGDYYWTVQAFAYESTRQPRRTGLVSGSAFSVSVQEPPVVQPPARPRPVTPPPAVVQQRPVAPPPVVPPPIILLPAAEDQKPANGYLIGPEQLRESLRLTFTWNAVQGANAYTFSVLSNSGREIIRTAALNQTSYTIEDLSILDVGNFIWQVEALALEDDGSIKQHGQIIQNRFLIDIPLPGDPGRHNTGTLYGR